MSHKNDRIKMRVEEFGNLAGHGAEMLHEGPSKSLHFPPEMAQDLKDAFNKWMTGDKKLVECILLEDKKKEDFIDVEDPVLKEMVEILVEPSFRTGSRFLSKTDELHYYNRFIFDRSTHCIGIFFPVGSGDTTRTRACEGKIHVLQAGPKGFYICFSLPHQSPDLDVMDVTSHLLNDVMIPVALSLFFRNVILSKGNLPPEQFDNKTLNFVLYNEHAILFGNAAKMYEAILKYFILLVNKYTKLEHEPVDEKNFVKSIFGRMVYEYDHYQRYIEKLPWFNFFPFANNFLQYLVGLVKAESAPPDSGPQAFATFTPNRRMFPKKS